MPRNPLIRLGKETFSVLTLEYPPVILTTEETADSLPAHYNNVFNKQDNSFLWTAVDRHPALTWREYYLIGPEIEYSPRLCVTIGKKHKPLYIKAL